MSNALAIAVLTDSLRLAQQAAEELDDDIVAGEIDAAHRLATQRIPHYIMDE